MNLSSSREYYAASDVDHNFETSQESGTHTIADVVLVKDEGNTYTCSGNIKINMNVDEGSMGSVLEPDDLILNIADNEDVINLKGEQLGIKETLDLSEINSTGTKEYPFSFEISHEDNEEIKIYVKFNNKTTAQNYLSGKELNMSVIVEDLSCKIKDQIAPEIKEFTIKGTEESPYTLTSGYTHSKNVTYTLSWTDEDVVSYCIKENSSCNSEDFKSTEGNNVTVSEPLLSSGDNRKTINAYIKDETGNVSPVKSESIILDETNPSIELAQKSVTTDTIVVTIAGSDTNGVTKRQCRIEEKSTNWTDAKLVNGEYQCTIGGLKENTLYNVEGRTIDTSGRISEVQSTNITTDIKCYSGNALGLLNDKCKPNGLNENLLGEMYRFVGTNGKVDNYVCFGYENADVDCKQGVSSDYIYRIIGITPEGQLKLIKYKYISEDEKNVEVFSWDDDKNGDITWPESSLFLRLNGKSGGSKTGKDGDTNLFIDSITSNVTYIKSSGDTTWYNKIEQKHSWWYGILQRGMYEGINLTAEEVYLVETGQQRDVESKEEWSTDQKVEAAIGLLYISDFYYSYAVDGLDSSLTNCYLEEGMYYSPCNSWVSDGVVQGQWLITRSKVNYDTSYAWSEIMNRMGNVMVYNGLHVHPVFFLTSEASQIESGTGTSDNPFIIVK